jgi:hypothetical protein
VTLTGPTDCTGFEIAYDGDNCGTVDVDVESSEVTRERPAGEKRRGWRWGGRRAVETGRDEPRAALCAAEIRMLR